MAGGNKRSGGFTLIELIVVIVILGILAATALPRFVNMQIDARVAKMQAARGAVSSAAALAYSAALISNKTNGSQTITMGGATVELWNGYPSKDGIVAAVGGLGDYTLSLAGQTRIIQVDGSHPNCRITYTESPTGGAPATYGNAPTSADCG